MFKMKKTLKVLTFILAVFVGMFTVHADTANVHWRSGTEAWGSLGNVRPTHDGESTTLEAYKIWLNDSTGAFCAEPGTTLSSGSATSSSLLTYFKNGLSDSAATTLNTKINQILYFGYGSTGRTSNEYYLATQKLIWDTIAATGFYTSDYYKSIVSGGVSTRTFGFSGIGLDLTDEIAAINNSITEYNKKPSFCGTTVELTGSEAKVLTDSNGVLGNYTMTAGNGVTAQVSGNKLTVSPSTGTTMTVTFTKAKAGSDAEIYTLTSNGYQRVISGGSVSASCKVTFTHRTTTVRISKQDITTERELPGAKLVLKDSTGATVDSWTSTSTPHEIENLAPGTYTLTETTAPAGYKTNTEAVTFTVKADGTVDGTVVMFNTPTKIKISKQDATTGKELAGAKLVLKDSTGKTVDSWTSTTKPHEVANLAAGTYTLTETIAPKGYVLSKETVTFTVKADGTVSGSVIMKNQPEEIPEGPKTGNVISAVSFFVGMLCLGYSVSYFLGLTKKREEE